MRKTKYLLIVLFVAIGLLLIPNSADAATLSSRDVYANNGSMRFNFADLELDTTHEYEFGFTTTSAAEVETWHLITEYTESTATVNINIDTQDLRNVFNASDTGYIRIKDVTTDEIVMEPFRVDLKMPYLKVANKLVLQNGHEVGAEEIQIACRSANARAYFQYQEVTNQELINRYKEIKKNNGDYSELENLITEEPPTAGWEEWAYFNGHGTFGEVSGYGKPERTINAPGEGLYYMWLYFTGSNVKDIYGVIFVDNLQPDVALESISLPRTMTVNMGSTLKLEPTFNPSTATNKIVNWKSSNEAVATVDNNGTVTPVSVGSTIITVTSEDGNKTANCTVTVTNPTENNDNNNTGDEGKDDGKDETVAPNPIPQTGEGVIIFVLSALVISGIAIAYIKVKKLKDIK